KRSPEIPARTAGASSRSSCEYAAYASPSRSSRCQAGAALCQTETSATQLTPTATRTRGRSNRVIVSGVLETLETEHAGEPRGGTLERLVEAAANLRLRREALDLKDAELPVGLHVGAPEQAVADEERQHVVAVHPLRRSLVDLDQMLEPEQPPDERPIPQQVVERREEDGEGGGAVEQGAGRHDDRRAAVIDLEAPEEASIDERVDMRLDAFAAAVEAAVLG